MIARTALVFLLNGFLRMNFKNDIRYIKQTRDMEDKDKDKFLSFFELYIENQFKRNALVTTQKLDKLIAAAPNIGFNCQPKIGIQSPAANGIPIAL